jgi:toxin ParE1/3/4
VRCLPLKKFPAMIHFTIDEKANAVVVWAVLNTYLDPKKHWKKKRG